jgi:hypothetical protein
VGSSLTMGYLTSNQRLIWSLKNEGLTEADIGRKLDIKRQTVHKALNVANQKILQALEETAKINKIEVQTVSPTQGYLIGYSPHFETQAFVTYSPKNGIQIWYKHEGHCKEDTSRTPPSKLADILFSMITERKNQ